MASLFIGAARNIRKLRNEIRALQAQNQNIREFSERSDRLAEKLGVALRELAPHLGISTAMLFAYRSGNSPISVKAWLKLEQAEGRAGLRVEASQGPQALHGSREDMRTDLRQTFERMLDAAGDDTARLGWLKVELDRQAAVTQSWLSADDINRQAVELAKKMAADEAKRAQLAASKIHTGARRAS